MIKTLKSRLALFAGAVALICFPVVSFAQAGGADIAKRALDSGIDFYRSGEYGQALQDFMTVINVYPNSEWVDEALLHVSRYYYEVEGDLAQARDYLQRIQREYAASNSTPDAYYYLGYILFDRRESVEQLRDGLANFERVVRFFPDSTVADDALFQASQVHVVLGEYDAALEKRQKILMDYPESELLIETQFEIGNNFIYMDDILQAMVEFQQVRNNYPESPWAEKALNRLTLLYRLHFSTQAGIRPFTRDTSFSLKVSGGQIDDPYYLVADMNDSIYLADRGLNAVLKFDSTGRQTERLSAQRPQMVKIGISNEVTILADRQLKETAMMSFRVGSGEAAEPLTNIEAFARGPMGQYYIYDGRRRELYCFKQDLTLEKTFRGIEFRDVRDMAIDQFGNILVLDGRQRYVVMLDSSGRRLGAIGPRIGDIELRDPTYIALDDANNLYILDRRQRSVYIFSPGGASLMRIGFGDSVSDPRGLAVTSSGEVIMIDRRQRSAVKFK